MFFWLFFYLYQFFCHDCFSEILVLNVALATARGMNWPNPTAACTFTNFFVNWRLRVRFCFFYQDYFLFVASTVACSVFWKMEMVFLLV